ALVERVKREQAALVAGAVEPARTPAAPPVRAAARIAPVQVPAPPDLERHVLRDVPLGHLYPYLNVQMLYGKHLGLRGPVARMLEDGDAKALELQEVVETLQTEAVRDGLLSAQGVYQWFRTRAAGETLTLFGAGGEPAERFTFPRQPDGERLCLADYVR